jgi:hypothetical protein
MSQCKVFDAVDEISNLKKRLAQLEEEVAQLRRGSAVYGPIAIGGWVPDSLPKPYDSWPVGYDVKYTLGGDE